jgi:hypothetical protein
VIRLQNSYIIQGIPDIGGIATRPRANVTKLVGCIAECFEARGLVVDNRGPHWGKIDECNSERGGHCRVSAGIEARKDCLLICVTRGRLTPNTVDILSLG